MPAGGASETRNAAAPAAPAIRGSAAAPRSADAPRVEAGTEAAVAVTVEIETRQSAPGDRLRRSRRRRRLVREEMLAAGALLLVLAVTVALLAMQWLGSARPGPGVPTDPTSSTDVTGPSDVSGYAPVLHTGSAIEPGPASSERPRAQTGTS